MPDSTPTLERAKSIATDAYAKEGPRKDGETHGHHVLRVAVRAALDASGNDEPLDLILHCPRCHLQHIDEPDERTPDWTNPPHRSHLCHGCGCIWRPADVPTNGVRAITTRGKADTWDAAIARTQEQSDG